jgi:hypothetical protein
MNALPHAVETVDVMLPNPSSGEVCDVTRRIYEQGFIFDAVRAEIQFLNTTNTGIQRYQLRLGSRTLFVNTPTEGYPPVPRTARVNTSVEAAFYERRDEDGQTILAGVIINNRFYALTAD